MQFSKTLLNTVFIAASLFVTISNSQAATVTGSFQVKINITSVCTVTAASAGQDINFPDTVAGVIATSNQTSITPLSVRCSKGTPYVINLTPSNGSSVGAGIMSGPGSPAATLAYQLNQSSGGSVWGNTGVIGTPGNAVSGTGTGVGVLTPISHPVYATVTGSTDVDIGTYTDTVTVSVVY